MRGGRMKFRIELQRRVSPPARGTDGSEVEAWETAATVWARKMEPRASEFLTADQQLAEHRTVWRIRYRPGITEAWRVVVGNIVHDIKGVTEPVRRREIELHTVAHPLTESA